MQLCFGQHAPDLFIVHGAVEHAPVDDRADEVVPGFALPFLDDVFQIVEQHALSLFAMLGTFGPDACLCPREQVMESAVSPASAPVSHISTMLSVGVLTSDEIKPLDVMALCITQPTFECPIRATSAGLFMAEHQRSSPAYPGNPR